jgi:2,4-dienoyl-CoA reductase-like NADH-dependent reductase (Old Yellow Enzyme family)
LGTNTLRFLHRIVTGIRGVSPPDFVLGIKLNAADYTSGGGDSEERALEHLRIITTWKMVDFIEISGGDYENPGVFRIYFFHLYILCSCLTKIL